MLICIVIHPDGLLCESIIAPMAEKILSDGRARWFCKQSSFNRRGQRGVVARLPKRPHGSPKGKTTKRRNIRYNRGDTARQSFKNRKAGPFPMASKQKIVCRAIIANHLACLNPSHQMHIRLQVKIADECTHRGKERTVMIDHVQMSLRTSFDGSCKSLENRQRIFVGIEPAHPKKDRRTGQPNLFFCLLLFKRRTPCRSPHDLIDPLMFLDHPGRNR